MTPACPCAARRADTPPPLVWPSDAWFRRWYERSRALLGNPALADVSGLPADVRGFVEREL